MNKTIKNAAVNTILVVLMTMLFTYIVVTGSSQALQAIPIYKGIVWIFALIINIFVVASATQYERVRESGSLLEDYRNRLADMNELLDATKKKAQLEEDRVNLLKEMNKLSEEKINLFEEHLGKVKALQSKQADLNKIYKEEIMKLLSIVQAVEPEDREKAIKLYEEFSESMCGELDEINKFINSL